VPPALDMEYEKRVHAAVRAMVTDGAVESAHDLSDGGLAVALAECTFDTSVGARIELASAMKPEFLLFHEGPSRVAVSTADAARVEAIAAAHNVDCLRIGSTANGEFQISVNGRVQVDAPVARLKERWAGSLEQTLHSEAMHV
jgi:phosphoribosylformylglycinamidine synthase